MKATKVYQITYYHNNLFYKYVCRPESTVLTYSNVGQYKEYRQNFSRQLEETNAIITRYENGECLNTLGYDRLKLVILSEVQTEEVILVA